MSDDRRVGQLERWQFCCSGGGAELVARASAQERPWAAVAGDHLFIVDAGGAERFLDPAARMHPRSAVIAVADEQRGGLGQHCPSRGS